MMSEVRRLGFTELCPSRDSCESSSSRVNIIFVHGLRGHPEKTWSGNLKKPTDDSPDSGEIAVPQRKSATKKWGSMKGWLSRKPSKIRATDGARTPPNAIDISSSRVFWPADLLAHDIPEARIWTYGYNADVIEGAFQAQNQNNVSQHGRDFAVKLGRDLDNDDPIIFVGHSLGGIVIKDAIHRSETCKKRTKLVVFLGTPHRGSSFADWARIAFKLASLARQDTNQSVVRGLEVNSEVLDRIQEAFIDDVHTMGIKIHSFQEGRAMTGVLGLEGKVVDDFSSKLDLPRALETVETLDADHRQIARPTDRDDPCYRAISGVLRHFIKSQALGADLKDLSIPDDPRIGIMKSTTSASEQTVKTLTNTKTQFYVPFSKNHRFVGRKSILDDLRTKFFGKGDTSHRVALLGFGGSGKTQVALEFALWTKDHMPGWSVFWLPALSIEGFEQACAAMLNSLEITDYDKNDATGAVKRYLESGHSGYWLLVVDNVDDEEISGTSTEDGIRNYLPRTDRGRILITSRFRKVAVDVDARSVVDVTEMSENEGRALLQKCLFDQDQLQQEESVAELLKILTYLPLAIVQAAAYLNENEESVSEYVRLLGNTEQDMAELLTTEFVDDTRYRGSYNAVANTWVLSFEQMRRKEDVMILLSFIAQIEHKAIPRSLLPDLGTEQRMTRAVGLLCAYSFLSKREGGLLDMHSLVHSALRIWMSRQDNADNTRRAALTHLSEALCSHYWENRVIWRQQLPHVLCALRGSDDEETWGDLECELGYWAGTSWVRDGRSREAMGLLEKVVSVDRRSHDEVNWRFLQSLESLATSYVECDLPKKAIDLLEKEVLIPTSTLPEWDPDLLNSQLRLVGAYENDGRLSEAESQLERLIPIIQTHHSDDESYINRAQLYLGRIHRSIGRTKKSIELLQQVLKRQEDIPENDPEPIATQFSLALAYESDGQMSKALEILERVVSVGEEVLSEENSDRLGPERKLGVIYRVTGENEKAVQLLEHVAAVEARLGEFHEQTLPWTLWNLGTAYTDLDRIADAIRVLKQVAAEEERLWGKEDPSRLRTIQDLGKVYVDNDQMAEGIELLEWVAEIQKTLEHEDPSQLSTMQVLGRAYRISGRADEAIRVLEWITKVQKKTLDDENTSRLESVHTLAYLYVIRDRPQDAIPGLEWVTEIERRTLPEESISRMLSLHLLGQAYIDVGRAGDAIPALEEVTRVEKTILEEEDPSRLKSLYTLGLAYKDAGRAEDAIPALEEVTRVEERTLEEGDPSRLKSLYVLGQAYTDAGRAEDGIRALAFVVAVERRTLENDDPSRLASLLELGRAYDEGGKVAEALETLEPAIPIYQRTMAADDLRRCRAEEFYAHVLAASKNKEADLRDQQ